MKDLKNDLNTIDLSRCSFHSLPSSPPPS
ncbi:hypothetical protein NGA_0137400, partial [Nannochloropsis gaditana CCMP526]